MAATFEEIGELLEIRVATAIGHARELFESGVGILQDLRLAETNRPIMGRKPTIDKVRVSMLNAQHYLGEAKKFLADIHTNLPEPIDTNQNSIAAASKAWDTYGSHLVSRGVLSQEAYDVTMEEVIETVLDMANALKSIDYATTAAEACIKILLAWAWLAPSNERAANEFNKNLEGPIFMITATRAVMNAVSEILDAFIHFNRCVCEQVRLHTQPQ